MFLICYNIHSSDKDIIVVIHATDTDCYAHAAAISKKIQSPLGLKRKDQLISGSELGQPNLAIQ